MSASAWAIRLAYVLDLIAMAALAGTGEVRLELFGGVLVLFAAGLFLHSRREATWVRQVISERTVLVAMLFVLFGAIGYWFRLRYHPIVIASYLSPLEYSLLWFAPRTRRYRGWRMGLGFVQIILSSALAPDFYLFPTIFIFALLGAVVASCNFLDQELECRAPENRAQALPQGFITRGLGLAGAIFLTSLIIFPILPRVGTPGKFFDLGRIGYTENVELSDHRGLSPSEGSGEVALRMYLPSDVDLIAQVYKGLIRGRALDFFDGRHWSATPRRSQVTGIHYVAPNELKSAVSIDVVRNTMPTNALPVPYGAVQVLTGTNPEDSPYPKTKAGEWVDSSSVAGRLKYTFLFFPFQNGLGKVTKESDPPVAIDTYVPDPLKTERMSRLIHTVFGNSRTEQEKVSQLLRFFQTQKFSASLDAGRDLEGAVNSPFLSRMHPIERFLFISKEGHCEWFASASAVLLRLAGVPSRLVAGFRISRAPVGGVLTVTTEDAHAWVEYWDPDHGWIAVDPTPRVFREAGVFSMIHDGYDLVSAYWYRYVLNYADDKTSGILNLKKFSFPSEESDQKRWLSPIFRQSVLRFKELLSFSQWLFWVSVALASAVIITSAVVAAKWIRRLGMEKISAAVLRPGFSELMRERRRMDRLVLRQLEERDLDRAIEWLESAGKSEEVNILKSWRDEYQRLRFGPITGNLSPESFSALREKYELLKGQLSGSVQSVKRSVS